MLFKNTIKNINNVHSKLYENLLLEDIEAVKRQYSYIPEEDFYKIIKIDPTYQDGSNSVGKYGKWLLGLYKKDNPLEYGVEEIYGLLSLYNEYKNDRKKEIEKDINKIKSIADLYDAVNNAGEAELSDRQKEREIRNSKDIKKIFEDSRWEIWIPQSFAGSCTLGKGTEWCTAYSENDSYYKEYTSQGPLYIFINKQNPKEKYQLHVESKSFMDKNDYEASLEDILVTDDKLREFVYRDIYGYKVDKNGNFIYDGNNRVPKNATKIIITDSVKYIRDGEFAHYESLQSIDIPNSVTEIRDSSFADCKSLQLINIPDSVTSIGDYAFDGCISLKSINIPNSVTSIGIGAFSGCKSLQSITIPDSVTSIGKHAFLDCTSLKSITIPNSVTYIGRDVFEYCESLQSINIPDSVASIDSFAFHYCKSLQSIVIPNSVITISEGAFLDCKSLQSIVIPDSVTYIGERAFLNCDNLKEVTLENRITIYEDNSFPKHTKVIKKGVNESLKANINEAIKVNDTLNPKLWDLTTNELLPDVENQLMSVVEVFEDYIDIPLNIVDIQLVGSNASFNYADTSDIDLHIIANFELTSTDTAILQALCDAKKTSFNKTYDIRIKGLEVEVYVQDINAGIVSNGIYSLCLDEWVKFPVPITNVAKHDNTIALKKWTDRINQVIVTNNKSEIEDAINILYLIRHNSIAIDGEYGAGNQLFKDIRSAGLLQQLKDALIKSTSDELSLEGFTPGQIVNRLR